MRPLLVLSASAVIILLTACGSESKPSVAETPKKAEAPKVFDETRRFPRANQVDSKVVQKELLDKPFMPGGTLVHYKRGKVEFDMFLAKLPSAEDAAILLLDWKKAMADAKLIPSFGGYFGKDGNRPVFVFPKGPWIAGVVGLPEKDADTQSRILAGQIQADDRR